MFQGCAKAWRRLNYGNTTDESRQAIPTLRMTSFVTWPNITTDFTWWMYFRCVVACALRKSVARPVADPRRWDWNLREASVGWSGTVGLGLYTKHIPFRKKLLLLEVSIARARVCIAGINTSGLTFLFFFMASNVVAATILSMTSAENDFPMNSAICSTAFRPSFKKKKKSENRLNCSLKLKSNERNSTFSYDL